jgi:transcriptional regulator with PAS, ATPase and Fis domain
MGHTSSISPIHPTDRIVGNYASIDALRAQIRHLAPFDAVGHPYVPTILLHGETGTGKGLVARVIHDSGPRAQGPFLDVNCAAIPEALVEAELFGYEAGAFTDARHAKPGLFEAASSGTLFLDEIDALPRPLQGKLLTAIEEKRGAACGRSCGAGGGCQGHRSDTGRSEQLCCDRAVPGRSLSSAGGNRPGITPLARAGG